MGGMRDKLVIFEGMATVGKMQRLGGNWVEKMSQEKTAGDS